MSDPRQIAMSILQRNTFSRARASRPFICLACYRHRRVLEQRLFYRSRDLVRSQSTWTQAVSTARELFRARENEHIGLGIGSKDNDKDKSKDNERHLLGESIDPLRVMAKEMKFLSKNMRQLLGSGHPMLDTVAKYYAASEGKHIRPLLVLLMSQATACTRPAIDWEFSETTRDSGIINQSLSQASVLNDVNPAMSSDSSGIKSSSSRKDDDLRDSDQIRPEQRRLAEITELIHTASLLHDDVIDISTVRRGAPSANVVFGNKMAVLAGDFLLGRASVTLARLRNPEVIELLATVIANLVEGEFMQLKNTVVDESRPTWSEETLSYYLQKTYLKSASLISKSCRAAAILGHNSPNIINAAYEYGKNLGLAFQLIDDMLDYTNTADELGKPAGADLELGLATAPLIFAWKENPELGSLVGRRFSKSGDVQAAREMVRQSNGLRATRNLAQDYADRATRAIQDFPDSNAKAALAEMCTKTMNRQR